MNDHDERLLRHVREHSREQPGPALDARILTAAADAAASRRRQTLGFWARLRRALGDASASRRWSAAFGCLALLGVGLGLSLQTLEQAPSRYDAPPASLQRQAPASPAPMAEMSEAPRVMARMAAKAAPPPAEVLAALREIAGLRERGDVEQARQRIEQLQAEHPGLDVEAEMRRLPKH